MFLLKKNSEWSPENEQSETFPLMYKNENNCRETKLFIQVNTGHQTLSARYQTSTSTTHIQKDSSSLVYIPSAEKIKQQ